MLPLDDLFQVASGLGLHLGAVGALLGLLHVAVEELGLGDDAFVEAGGGGLRGPAVVRSLLALGLLGVEVPVLREGLVGGALEVAHVPADVALLQPVAVVPVVAAYPHTYLQK